MKSSFHLFLTFILGFVLSISAYGQITAVKYMLKYNPQRDFFDCYLIVTGGRSETIAHRTQSDTRVSLAVPTGTKFNIVESYMPLIGNQNYNSTRPVIWEITAKNVMPSAQPKNDFIGIEPSLLSESHYNDLNTGDTIKLFSIKMDTIVGCASGIRLFENGLDLSAADPTTPNINFENYFTLGGAGDIYTGNYTLNYPAVAGKDENVCGGSRVDLVPMPFSKGYWSLPPSNPKGANLKSLGSSNAELVFEFDAPVGVYTVIYIDSSLYDMKCITLTRPVATIAVDSIACDGGGTQLIAAGGQTYKWSTGASTPNIGINNTANYTVTVTDAFGCTASTSMTVSGNLGISLPGGNICLNTTHTLPNLSIQTWNPTLATGRWESSNPSIATTTSAGVVTPLSPGDVIFTFYYESGNCYISTDTYTIYAAPVIELIGPELICTGNTTQVLPSSGGTWSSSNPSLLTVTNSGLVTGVAQGSATLIYTSNIGCVSSNEITITVNPLPTVLLDGPDQICIGGTTNVQPTSGGTWQSDNPFVAIINNAGLVTGVGAGSATFTFTDIATGCTSIRSFRVFVLDPPMVAITGPTDICVGGYSQLSPTSGGIWVSSNPAIATVTNSGLIGGISLGRVNFVFTSNATGCYSNTLDVTVYPIPNVQNVQMADVCVGSTVQPPPLSIPGFWSAYPASKITQTNNTFKAIAPGIVKFFYTSTPANCVSDSVTMNILDGPALTYMGSNNLCLGSTLQLNAVGNGTWSSSDPIVGSIATTGLFTSLSPGSTDVVFTYNSGCQSTPLNIQVFPNPTVPTFGNPNACVGIDISIPDLPGGSWSASPASVIIKNGNVYNTLTPGVAKFVFTSDMNGCISDTVAINIHAFPTVSITGSDQICSGYTTTLSLTTGGTWQGSNNLVATISNSGLVTGISAGTTTFIYTDAQTGCASNPTDIITVHDPFPNVLTLAQTSILATSGADKYEWFDCTNNTKLATTTEPFYTPSQNGNYYAIITSGPCFTQTDCIDFIIIGSDDERKEDIKLYPNPTKNNVQVISPYEIQQIVITDVQGKTLLQSLDKEVDVSTLNAGIYLLKVQTKFGILQKYLVIVD